MGVASRFFFQSHTIFCQVSSSHLVNILMKMLSREHKHLFARLLFNSRELLFGSDEGAETENSLIGQTRKGDKQNKWMEILNQLQSVGASDVSDYRVLRDVEWSNLRRGVEKRLANLEANRAKPPEEQQIIKAFTKTEEIVADILGKGAGTTQSEEIDLSEYDSLTSNSQHFKIEVPSDDEAFDYEPQAKKAGKSAKKRPIGVLANGGFGSQVELNELRRKKLRLECAKLELELEKIPLECAKLELEIQHLQKTLVQPKQGSSAGQST